MFSGYLSLQRERLLVYVLVAATPRGARIILLVVARDWDLCEALDLAGDFLSKVEFIGGC